MAIKLTQQQVAAMTLANLYAISDVLRKNGEILDPEKWLFCLAHALGSAGPGILPIPRQHQRKPAKWFGLEFDTLKLAAERCGLEATDEQIEKALGDVSNWRKRNPSVVCLRPDTYAYNLGVTPEVRREARATFVGAIGETANDRKVRRRANDLQTKARNRREAGMRPHSESLSQRRPVSVQRATSGSFEVPGQERVDIFVWPCLSNAFQCQRKPRVRIYIV